ncbi:MAG TPA: hypothetical protein VGE07_29705 [Herpetosiphonaceae bacterium]
MVRKWISWAGLAAGILAALVFFAAESTCYACTAQNPPPDCSANLSEMTVEKGALDPPWWAWLTPRDEESITLFIGMNYNNGVQPLEATYDVAIDDPAFDQALPPESRRLTFKLDPDSPNDTQLIRIPLRQIPSGDLRLTATLAGGGQPCQLPQTLEGTVRVNDDGPVVWPITPRACPLAGEERELTFGVLNPSDQQRTYVLSATAENANGQGGETFNLAAQGATATLPPVTIEPGETATVTLDCETFGFCLTGGENTIRLDVRPVAGSDESFAVASAASSVTVRAPAADCNELEDWWLVMSPLLLGSLVGGGLLGLGGLGLGGYKLYNGRYTTVSGTPLPGQAQRNARPKPSGDGKGSVSTGDSEGKLGGGGHSRKE